MEGQPVEQCAGEPFGYEHAGLTPAPKCNCRTCRIRRMDSLSVGIRVPSIDCDGETWTRVKTDPRDDLLFSDALLAARRRAAGINLEWWPPSDRNTWPPCVGIRRNPKGERRNLCP